MSHLSGSRIHWLFVCFLAFLCIIVAVESAFSQVPAPIPDPTITALENTMRSQQLKIDFLTQELEILQRKLSLTRDEVNNDLDKRLLLVTSLVSFVGGFVIIVVIPYAVSLWYKLRKIEKSLLVKVEGSLAEKATTMQDSLLAELNESLPQQVRIQIANSLQHIDPTNVCIHYPEKGFEKELQRLKKFGFLNFESYVNLDKSCLEGCVIVRLTETGRTEVDEFSQFIQNNKLTNEVGYLFYNKSKEQFPTDLLEKHSVTDYCTSITTLGPNVLTIARNLGG